MFIIAIASPAEMRGIQQKLVIQKQERFSGTLCIRGILQGKEIALVKTGVGMAKAGASIRKIIKQYKPACVLIIGAAGATDASLRVGDIVVIKKNMYTSGQHFFCDTALSEKAFKIITRARMPVGFGDIVTMPTFVHLHKEKKSIFKTYGGHVIDMESTAIAEELCTTGIPFLNIRVVSDMAGEDTVDIESLFSHRKKSGTRGAFLYFLRKPSDIARALRLRKNISQVSTLISTVVELLSEELFN